MEIDGRTGVHLNMDDNYRHAVRGPGGRFVSTGTDRPPLRVRPRGPARKPGTGFGQFQSMVNPNLNIKKSRHVIDDISFARDYIVCTCAWKGPIDNYQPHRKEEEPSVSKKRH